MVASRKCRLIDSTLSDLLLRRIIGDPGKKAFARQSRQYRRDNPPIFEILNMSH
jgi:hypothetical protein